MDRSDRKSSRCDSYDHRPLTRSTGSLLFRIRARRLRVNYPHVCVFVEKYSLIHLIADYGSFAK